MNTTLLLGLALFSGWAYLLWSLARSSRTKKVWFYVTAFLPFLISLLFMGDKTLYALIFSSILTTTLTIIIIAYMIGWAMTLYEVAGENKLIWFILILLVSPLWLLYLFTQLR